MTRVRRRFAGVAFGGHGLKARDAEVVAAVGSDRWGRPKAGRSTVPDLPGPVQEGEFCRRRSSDYPRPPESQFHRRPRERAGRASRSHLAPAALAPIARLVRRRSRSTDTRPQYRGVRPIFGVDSRGHAGVVRPQNSTMNALPSQFVRLVHLVADHLHGPNAATQIASPRV